MLRIASWAAHRSASKIFPRRCSSGDRGFPTSPLSIQVRVTSPLERPRRPWSMFIRLALGASLLVPLATHFAFCQPAAIQAPPNGQAIFAQRCAQCHGQAGEGISAIISIAGPSLIAEHDHGAVMTAIEVGPSHMPSFAYVLSVPEMRSVADYVTQKIAVLPLTGGNLGEGGELFRINCAVCHRTTVRGGALAFTGVNAPALTGKSAAIIAGAIRWGPGPMPPFPASVLSNQQLASIVEYVKFVQHPPTPGGNPLKFIGPAAEGFIAFIAILILIAFTMWIERRGKG
ncbi:MAG: c-type cytochrome [Acidobacteriaceae bacterium]